MTERRPLESISRKSYEQYFHGSMNADIRRELYRFADPPYDIWKSILEDIDLQPDSRILDDGTGSGHMVDLLDARISREFGDNFRGSLIAIDKYPQNFATRLNDPRFRQDDAEKLSFDDKSFTVITNLFVGYHADPNKILEQIVAKLDDGGQAIISTRSPGNQGKCWEFAGKAAESQGYTAPESFYSSWDLPTAFRDVSMLMEVKKVEEQNSPLKIPLDLYEEGDELGWQLVRQAIATMTELITENGSDRRVGNSVFLEYLNTEVKQSFLKEVAASATPTSHGYFEDRAIQGYIVANKRATLNSRSLF